MPLERPLDESTEIIAIERLGGLLRSERRAASFGQTVVASRCQFFTARGKLLRSVMIQRQFVSIFTMSHTEFGREPHHLKRSEFVFQRASGSFQFFHHTGSPGIRMRHTGADPRPHRQRLAGHRLALPPPDINGRRLA